MDVVVFSYNRADKLKMCLESIDFTRVDTLWLFCDGAKNEGHEEGVRRNQEVAMAFRWERKRVVVRPHNFGTPRNVISGLDDVFSTTDACFILEDDCIVKSDAYEYVDWALDRFRDDQSIFSVNTMAPLNGSLNRLASLLIKADVVATSRVFAFWGWATWADRWKEFRPRLEPFCNPYKNALNTPLNYGAHVRWTLEQFEQGKAGGWDARLMVLCGHAKRLHIHPMTSMMRNIGLDGSGSHFKASRARVDTLTALQWSSSAPRVETFSDIREPPILRQLHLLASVGSYARTWLIRVLPRALINPIRSRRRRAEGAGRQW